MTEYPNKKNFFSRFQYKIELVAFVSAFLGLLLTVFVSYYGIQVLFKNASQEIQFGINSVSKEYMNNYIIITREMVESKIQKFFDEQAILADIYQTYLDHYQEFEPLNKTLIELPFFKDKLSFNGRWYQNMKDEPATVLVQRYLLDNQNNILPDAKQQIDKSAILDLLMPSVYKYGAKKLWVYLSGPKEASFMRIAPWNDAGSEMDRVYPKHTDEENWEAFNPGLVEAWEKKIQSDPAYKADLSSLAIVKSPTQDGGTGKIIMTMDHPVWNPERTKFQGSINVDIELEEIISCIKNVRLAKTGFAFISQSNGNVFAVNETGEKILGLKSIEASTVKGNTGIGFNPMERFFSGSIYDNVRNIQLPKSNQITTSEININDKDYIVIQQNLASFNTWDKNKGFYKDSWTLGFVVPKEEIFTSYYDAQDNMNKSRDKIIYLQMIIAVLTILVIGIGILIATKKMTKSLGKLELAAVEIMNSNYDVYVDVDSKDELGKLAKTLNNMVAEIKSTFQQLRIQNEQLKNEIAEKQDREKQIKYLEDYDVLTKLPNQNLFQNELAELTRKNDKTNRFAIILIGVDNFRHVNEVLGHSGGNEVLKMMANRLRGIAQNIGAIARVSGDEFALILEEADSIEEITRRVENIMMILSQDYRINTKELYITSCVGISLYPADSKDETELIKFASSALMHAKEKGIKHYQFYDVNINKSAEKRILMISELRNAIEKNELELYYQPQIDLGTKKYVGVEALLRWNSAVFGRIMPGIFIPLAEESGLILDIGEWVLKTACDQNKKWHDMGFKELVVAVNLSPLQFNQENLVTKIENILSETKLPAMFLELEVTESFFINDIKNAVNKLNELRKLGIKIAMDDFGTGYSSLSYIQNLPIDKLKIDRTFIKDIPSKDQGTIANIIIELAKHLKIKVNAEGVETIAQERFLTERMCNEVQGYYYSVPLRAEELTNKLVSDRTLIDIQGID